MTILKTAATSTALVAGGLMAAAPQDADAQIRFSFGSGYGGHYDSYYQPYHRRGRVWHDTSHYDYHPGGFERHRGHYHYVPGHYHFHRDGHWDRIDRRGRLRHRHHDHDD